MRKKNSLRISLVCLSILLLGQTLQAQFVHPGCLHKKSDLDRMKYMVEAEIEPYISTYNKLKTHAQASYTYTVKGDTTMTEGTDGLISSDGAAAYLNALMWYITGDERHAKKCVEIFNAWVNVTKTNGFALRSGTSSWKLIEGAEIIKSTYSGWKEEDIARFKAMLVYPGYSNTTIPNGDKSFYWNILNGDPGRHGNQDAIAFRAMISMGVFLDNEIMYDRALNYYKGLPHRPDDIPYASGPGVSGSVKSDNPYFTNYANSNPGTIPDYGFNGVLEHYFWENGQCQESSRDQAHTFFGLGIFEGWAEVAWNQGDDAWNYLDNRLLKAFEFNLKYNISYIETYPDQPDPWEPTVESGEFIQRTDRTGRWRSKAINPHFEGDFEKISRGNFLGTRPIFEQAMAHFDVRMGFSEEQTLWTARGRELYGIEENGWTVDHPGWGGLTFHRPDGCAGDPIRGFVSGQTPVFAMHHIGDVIQAENYDCFAGIGESRTYHDLSEENTGGKYRLNDYVDIDTCSEGGYMLTDIEEGEWLTYTLNVPEFSIYDIKIRYAALRAGGKIKFSFGGDDKTAEVPVPFGEGYSTGLTDWKDLTVGSEVFLNRGVQSMKISISGASNSFVLNNILIEKSDFQACDEGMPAVELPSRSIPGNYYSYYEGGWDTLPDFNDITPVYGDFITDTIQLASGIVADTFAVVFNGYLKVALDGNYTFYLNAADGSRLFIDGAEIIHDDGSHDGLESSGDICLMAGYHAFRLEYYNSSAAAELWLKYAGPGVPKQILTNTFGVGPCENLPLSKPDSLVQGIKYSYYEGEWTVLPNFTRQALSGEGILPKISLSPAEQSDNYAFTFEGYFRVGLDGEYAFHLASDDGSRLLIDGEEVVDNDGTHGVVEKYGTICLAPGFHHLYLEYFESTGATDSLGVMYSGPDFEKRVLTDFFAEPLVPKQDQILTFDEIPVMNEKDSYFFPRAKSSAKLSPTYTSSNLEVATVNDRIIYIRGVGTSVITASFPGTSEYNPASIEQTLIVMEDDTPVDRILNNNIKIHPNPVNDVLMIEGCANARAEICNVAGKKMFEHVLLDDKHSISTQTLEKGIYVVIIHHNGFVKTFKLVKQ